MLGTAKNSRAGRGVNGRGDAAGVVLFGKTRRAVLGLLFTRPGESFYLRQIARLVGVAPGAVQRELATLEEAGIVTRERRSNATFYRANPVSPVFPELRGLIVKTVGLADVLRDVLAPLRGSIRVAFLFGSFVRGEQRAASDVDVMVVAGAALRFADLSAALTPAQARLGRDVNPTVFPPAELARKARAGHHFVTSVLAGPKIFLIGDEHQLLTVAGQRAPQTAPALPRRARKALPGRAPRSQGRGKSKDE
jgi:uncharacterized protein